MSILLFREPRHCYSYHPVTSVLDRMMNDISDSLQDYDRSERNQLDMPKDSQIVNDDSKFAVSLNVHQFKPEELKVNLEDRLLTIEGVQEEETEEGYCKRSFVRKWLLPEDVDADQIESTITEEGTLQIEAKKKTGPKARNIPIMSKQ